MPADKGRLVTRPDISFHAGRQFHTKVHPQTLGLDDCFVVGSHDGSFWSGTAVVFMYGCMNSIGIGSAPQLLAAAPLVLPMPEACVCASFPSPAEDFTVNRLDLTQILVTHPQATFLLRVAGPLTPDGNRGCDQRALRQGDSPLGGNWPDRTGEDLGDEARASHAAVHDEVGGCASGQSLIRQGTATDQPSCRPG